MEMSAKLKQVASLRSQLAGFVRTLFDKYYFRQ